MTILHFIPDEKFTPFLQDVFSSADSGKNLFIVYGNETGEPRFAKKNPESKLVSKAYWHSEEMRADLRNATVIIAHSMSDEVARAICRAPGNVPVIWRGWGFDYYHYLSDITGPFILPDTKKLWDADRKRSVSQIAVSLPGRIWRRISVGSKYDAAIKRISHFSCCVPQDFARLKSVMPWKSVSFIPLNYYSVEKSFTGAGDIVGDDILLGNSATPGNNHVEAMEWLRDQELGARRVVVPLSYGDKAYTKRIVELGAKWLGKNFRPLLDYYSIEQYNKISAECSVVIMNHIRQQGMGNVAASLYRGAKVILRPENPIRDLYASIGVEIGCFSAGSGSDNPPGLLDSDMSVSKECRKKVGQYWAHENALEQARQICATGIPSVERGSDE